MKIRNPKSKILNHGYTVIELLLVFGVISILFISGYIGFGNYQKKKLISNWMRTLKSDIALAQGSALAGFRCAADRFFGGSRFYVVSQSQYKVQVVCININNPTDISYSDRKSVDIPGDIFITSPAAGTGLTFKPLAQGTSLMSSLNIVLTSSVGGLRISIDPSGKISEPFDTGIATPTP